jgi:hypothetical protein
MASPSVPLAHIDEAEGEVNLHAPRKQRHDAYSSVGRDVAQNPISASATKAATPSGIQMATTAIIFRLILNMIQLLQVAATLKRNSQRHNSERTLT